MSACPDVPMFIICCWRNCCLKYNQSTVLSETVETVAMNLRTDLDPIGTQRTSGDGRAGHVRESRVAEAVVWARTSRIDPGEWLRQ